MDRTTARTLSLLMDTSETRPAEPWALDRAAAQESLASALLELAELCSRLDGALELNLREQVEVTKKLALVEVENLRRKALALRGEKRGDRTLSTAAVPTTRRH